MPAAAQDPLHALGTVSQVWRGQKQPSQAHTLCVPGLRRTRTSWTHRLARSLHSQDGWLPPFHRPDMAARAAPQAFIQILILPPTCLLHFTHLGDT